MKEIKKITSAVEYIVYHLSEYKDNEEATRTALQDYYNKAWKLFHANEASEVEVLQIQKMCKTVCMIFNSSTKEAEE